MLSPSHSEFRSSAWPVATDVVPPPIYIPPAEVFQYWFQQHLAEYPGQRPLLKWLSERSGLPESTCCDYRRAYEKLFPELYALFQIKRNLRAARRGKQKRATLYKGQTPNSEK